MSPEEWALVVLAASWVTAGVVYVAMERRERCGWCDVRLRWWQLKQCLTCRLAFTYDRPGPPFPHKSRTHAQPDRWFS